MHKISKSIIWSITHQGYGCNRHGEIFSKKRGSIKKLSFFLERNGYLRFHMHPGGKYLVSRFVYETISGNTISCLVDHKNRIKTDNRFCNLREASHSENIFNAKKQKNCSSKHKGVVWHKARQKWQANIKVNSKTIYLGIFKSEKEAASAYKQAALKYAGKFANY